MRNVRSKKACWAHQFRYLGVDQQYLGVFRDWYVGLKSLSEKGPLHMGGVTAPLCNLDCPRKSLRRCAGRCDCYLFVNAQGLGKTLLEREANAG